MTTSEKTKNIKVIISGSNGKMGKILRERIAQTPNMEVVAGFGRKAEFLNPMDFKGKADVLIDFSSGSFLKEILDFCLKEKIPAIIATTGLDAEHKRLIIEASKIIPILQDYNLSIQVILLITQIESLIKKYVELGIHKECQIDIYDIHHDQKLDSPSGTTNKIIDAINQCLPEEWQLIPVYGWVPGMGKRKNNQIVIHSSRAGKVPGTHSVCIYLAGAEKVTIMHEAFEKDIFANGAIAAARFMSNKDRLKRVYTTLDMLGQI